MPSTIIYNDTPTQAASVDEGDDLWLSLDDLRAATGWEIKPEGACLDEICIPLPDSERGRLLRGEGEQRRFNVTAFARYIGQPVIHDAQHDLWYFGTQWVLGTAHGAATTSAPEFTLPDIEGRMHSLSDHRGKKVLLATWASW